MKLLFCLFLVLSNGLLAGTPARAATRPRFGGTLKIELKYQRPSLDPHGSKSPGEAAGLGRLSALVFDRLVRLDSNGRPRPALSLSWEHDAQNIKWRLKLRSDVKWHDGLPLLPSEIAAALEGKISDRPLRVVGDLLEIDAGIPSPDLPAYLATSLDAFVRRQSSDGTKIVGTGPFRLTDWQPGVRAVLQANDDYWDGRPFLDGIEIEMGRASRDQLMDWQMETVDLVELDPSEARRAQQGGRQVWNSASVELIFLRMDSARPKIEDRRLREAIARSIDRSAIQKVLLQNFGEAVNSIFPQWLSGYAFLFPAGADLDLARRLREEVGPLPALKLGYDSDDALARQVAERVAVNARDAGITLQVTPPPGGAANPADGGADLAVARARITGPTLAEAALQAAVQLQFHGSGRNEPEEVFAIERQELESYSIIPLVSVPDLIGVGPRVRNWSPAHWGDWHLEDVWLETGKQ